MAPISWIETYYFTWNFKYLFSHFFFSFYFTWNFKYLFSHFFHSFFLFHRTIGSKRASLAYVVTSGSPTKKPHSDVASNLSNAFKGASFAGRKSTGDHNTALEKEGKLFVQFLYPDNAFADGISLTTLYIKVIQYKDGRAVPVWYCNSNFFTAAFKQVLKSTKDVDLGSEWLNYEMKFMVETKTSDTSCGSDVQKPRSNKWRMTHMTTYLKSGDTLEETVPRVKSLAECVMTYLSESVGEWGKLYYHFEEAFRK
jgi:hypothetical protein